MPSTATREDCEEALLMAYELGIKGMTIYRTGSREDVVLSLKEPASPASTPVSAIPVTSPVVTRAEPDKIPSLSIDRPNSLRRTYLCQSGCCRLYVTVNLLDEKPIEVFIRTVGSGGCDANSSALGRAIRYGSPERRTVRKIRKTVCESELYHVNQESLFGRTFLRGCCREMHRTLGKKPERYDPQ